MYTDLAAVARNNRRIALAQLAARKSGKDADRVSRLPRPFGTEQVSFTFTSVRAQRADYRLAA